MKDSVRAGALSKATGFSQDVNSRNPATAGQIGFALNLIRFPLIGPKRVVLALLGLGFRLCRALAPAGPAQRHDKRGDGQENQGVNGPAVHFGAGGWTTGG